MNLYDPKKLSLNIAAKDVTGLSGADGFLKLEPMTADYISSQAGIKGDVNISEIYDGRVKMTVILMGDSPLNQYFFGLGEGRIAFPVTVKNKSDGGVLGFDPGARLMTKTTYDLGKEYKDRTWVFLLPGYSGVLTA